MTAVLCLINAISQIEEKILFLTSYIFMHFRLKDHALNPDLPPVLIFPEGVCVNNTCVMQFKKGAFEVGVTNSL